MRLAFLISAHTDPHHLKRLIEALPLAADFYVHIDLKADIHDFESLIHDDRVTFIQERYDVMWGSFKQVQFQMALLRAALTSSRKYDYLITMSGLDYPIWSNQRITDFFEENKGKEFISGMLLTEREKTHSVSIYRSYWFLYHYSWPYGTLKSKFRVALRKALYALGVRKPLYTMVDGQRYDVCQGPDWWAVTSELAAYMLDFTDHHPSFVSYFKTLFSPNEGIWQTIAYHSPFAKRCMFRESPYPGLCKLTPLTYVEYPKEVKVFTEDDYETILNSGKLFCRKTVTGKSDRLMDMIDRIRCISQ